MDTPYGRFRYAVAKTTTVSPSDVGVLRDRGYGLVLTTCTPPYSAASRLIVWATLEKSQTARERRGASDAGAGRDRQAAGVTPGNGGRSEELPSSSMTSNSSPAAPPG